MRTIMALLLPAALLLAGSASGQSQPQSAAAPSEVAAPEPPKSVPPEPPRYYPGETTRILSKLDAGRLLHTQGLTLHWIDWQTRGRAVVTRRDGMWLLRGAQSAAGGPGRLFLDGAILEIGPGYFTFRGTIRISEAPDAGRQCEANKIWHFAVTQRRHYYRLREFEWCDYLTDYIDIYF